MFSLPLSLDEELVQILWNATCCYNWGPRKACSNAELENQSSRARSTLWHWDLCQWVLLSAFEQRETNLAKKVRVEALEVVWIECTCVLWSPCMKFVVLLWCVKQVLHLCVIYKDKSITTFGIFHFSRFSLDKAKHVKSNRTTSFQI